MTTQRSFATPFLWPGGLPTHEPVKRGQRVFPLRAGKKEGVFKSQLVALTPFSSNSSITLISRRARQIDLGLLATWAAAPPKANLRRPHHNLPPSPARLTMGLGSKPRQIRPPRSNPELRADHDSAEPLPSRHSSPEEPDVNADFSGFSHWGGGCDSKNVYATKRISDLPQIGDIVQLPHHSIPLYSLKL